MDILAGGVKRVGILRLRKPTRFARRLASLRMTGVGVVGVGEAVLFAGLLLLCSGCARRATASLPDLEIPVRCVAEVRMVGCDARVSPPKCRTARVTYRSRCEEILVGKR